MLKLYRLYETKDLHNKTITIGELKHNEKLICVIIEPKGPATEQGGQNQRIPTGEYLLEKTKTGCKIPSKYKEAYLLTSANNPNFALRRIIIHIGNYAKDTKGCLLPNRYYDKRRKQGINSTIATENLYNLIESNNIKKIYISEELLK